MLFITWDQHLSNISNVLIWGGREEDGVGTRKAKFDAFGAADDHDCDDDDDDDDTYDNES